MSDSKTFSAFAEFLSIHSRRNERGRIRSVPNSRYFAYSLVGPSATPILCSYADTSSDAMLCLSFPETPGYQWPPTRTGL